MTPQDEAVALRWISRRVLTWTCEECGGKWITGRSTPILFHRCKPPRRRGWTPTTDARDYAHGVEERHRLLFDELLRVQGPESIWRPIENSEGEV